MDLLQEAFIHPPKLCEARFITDACALFQLRLDFNSDWIRLKEESHRHLVCLEGEYITG